MKAKKVTDFPNDMEDSVLRLVADHVHRYQKIGVCIPSQANGDILASASAFASALGVLGKTVTLVSPDVISVSELSLPFVDQIAPLHVDTSHLVVQLDTTTTELGELSYETVPGKVRIFLRPKEGSFSPHDITVQAAEFPFDLIILCGVQRPEQLGALFTHNVELFYSLPRINIDVDPGNETYGTINIISVATSSVSELVYRLLAAIDEVVTIPPAATALLTGIFQATNHLRAERTTPETFAVVADLVAAGAQYRTVRDFSGSALPRLSSMQLYGRILARMHEVAGGDGLYALVQDHDLEKTGERAVDVVGIATRVLKEIPKVAVVVFGVPTDSGVRVEVVSTRELHTDQLQSSFAVEGWSTRTVGTLWQGAALLSQDEQGQAVEARLKVGAERLVETMRGA